jgi:hypothetical protein
MDAVDREAIYEELRRAGVTFRHLVEDASPADLARSSDGTRWTNQQLLFHMLFGYLLMRAVIVLAGVFARLPASASRVFARLLDAVTGPFHWINYLGSCAGAKIFPAWRMAGKMGQVTMALEQRLRARPAPGCVRGCTTRSDGIRSSRLRPWPTSTTTRPSTRLPPPATLTLSQPE